MATEIDELITKLSYEDNSAALEEADKRVTELSESNEKAAKTTEQFGDQQLKLAQQLQASKERTDRLKTEQKTLAAEMRKAGGGTAEQRTKLKSLNTQLEASKVQTKKLQTQQARLGLEQKKTANATKKTTAAQRKLVAATKRASAATKKQVTGLGKFASRVSTIVSGLAIRDIGRDIIAVFTEAARAVAGLVPEFAALADETGKAAKGLGVNVEVLQRLRFAGERSGVAVGTMDKSLSKLTKGLEDARIKGTGPVADAFEVLGLSVDKFQRLNTEQRVGAIADAMQKVESPTQRSALVMTLFGGKAKEMAVLLNEGSEGIKALGDRAQELGGVIDEDAVTAAERLSDQFLDITTFGKGLTNTLAIGLAPLVEQLTTGILGWVEANRGLIDQGLEAVANTLAKAFSLIGEIIAGIPVEKLVALFADLAVIVGALAEQLISGAAEGGGMISVFLDLAVIAADMAAAILELFGAFQTLDEETPQIPSLFDAISAAVGLLVRGFGFFAELLTKLLRLLTPVIEEIGALASSVTDAINPIDSLAETFGFAESGASALTASTAALNSELATTQGAALGAVAALEKLAGTKDKASAEGRAESEAKETTSKTKAKQAKGESKLKDKRRQADRSLDKKGTSKARLTSISTDFDLTAKQRARAKKLLEKRRKAGGKAAAAAGKGLVTAKVEAEIQARATEAGERAAARELVKANRAGEAPDKAAINKVQRDETKRVKENLSQRFAATGELPSGIRSDLIQTAATPGVEAAGGRVAPPVVTITNIRVVGTTINVETNVAASSSSARDIAAANVAGIRGLSERDVGMAILNNQTNERR